MGDELTITLNRGSAPVLVTGDPRVLRATLDALVEVLEGAPRKRVLRLAREAEKPEGAEPGRGGR